MYAILMQRRENMLHNHNIPPIYNEQSRVLILGTFPSVQSRECIFYYSHGQNRFWPLMARLLGEAVPETVEGKTELLLRNGIALWDVIESCEIEQSSDASIRNVTPNDIRPILESAPIERIVANGKWAEKLYNKHIYPITGREIIPLPSTSPANAACSLDRLAEAWKIIMTND